MKKENVINLIKYHMQKNDLAFNNEVQLIAQAFEKRGDSELAQYIMALVSGHNVFVPQELENNSIEKDIVAESGFASNYIQKTDLKDELNYFTKIDLNSEPLLLPEKILDDVNGIIMAISNKRKVNTFLFSGEPGTGKTETVKQIARILKRQLYSVHIETVIDSKLGQSGKNIVALFDEINHFSGKENAIFLFDELDVLAMNRIDSNDLREMGRATSYVMKGLDTLSKDVMLFATTNLHEFIDSALLRRFDAIVDFNRYESDELIDIAENILIYSGKMNNVEITNIPLFRKMIRLLNPIPYPGDIKNLINSSVAFSDSRIEDDYLHRLFQKIFPDEMNDLSAEQIKKFTENDFTVRELETLTGISKSQISRMIRRSDE